MTGYGGCPHDDLTGCIRAGAVPNLLQAALRLDPFLNLLHAHADGEVIIDEV